MTLLSELRRDAAYAVRLLGRAPGFAFVAIATLALGIGASTSIFTVVDRVLLRPLRFAEPDRLVMLRPSSGARLSAGYLHDWRVESRTLADMAGWLDERVSLTGDGEPVEVRADRVTTNFLAVVGMAPALGRTFSSSADLSRVEPEVMISHALWQQRYGSDPAIIGRTLIVAGTPATVVGIMPQGFAIRTTELAESRADLWLPYRLDPGARVGMGGTLHVVARLAPGVAHGEAQAELATIARRLEEAHPSYSRDWTIALLPLLDATVMEIRPILLVLFGGVGILLIIGCGNVTNLLLARAASRQTEFAIRMSIGATGGRLLRQSLTESVVLSVIGGALGVVLAIWGTQLLVAALPAGLDLPRTSEIGVDTRILGFALLVTVATAAFMGIVPALGALRLRPGSSLSATARGSSAAPARTRASSTLVVAEVALAVVLLAGAGLLARSFLVLTRVEPGFNAGGVLTLRTTLAEAKYGTNDARRAFNEELLARTHALPGVRAAGTVSYLPLSNTGRAGRFQIEGRPDTGLDNQRFALTAVVSGRYFEAMQIPLVRGRLPNESDTAQGEPIFVIDQGLARDHWPDSDPIGARLTMSIDRNTRITGPVIGVVGDVKWTGLAARAWSTAYMWYAHAPERELSLAIRTAGEPTLLAAPIAAAVRQIDPHQPVSEIRVMADLVAADLARPRFTMLVLGAFAAAALLLAAIGLYGVLAYTVAQRTREIGVRVALGAGSRDILLLVVGRGARLVAAGLVLGLALALMLGRFVAGLLYGVTPSDAPTLAIVTLFLTLVACVATYLPARRAARVDPIVALRAE
jgi:putative ABC transport system permease protein